MRKSFVASLSLRITVLSSQQVARKCSAWYSGAAHKLTEKDLAFANSSDLLFSGLTEICVPVSRGPF